jgi:hypothetical protein
MAPDAELPANNGYWVLVESGCTEGSVSRPPKPIERSRVK